MALPLYVICFIDNCQINSEKMSHFSPKMYILPNEQAVRSPVHGLGLQSLVHYKINTFKIFKVNTCFIAMDSWHSLVLPYILTDIHTFLFKSLSACQKKLPVLPKTVTSLYTAQENRHIYWGLLESRGCSLNNFCLACLCFHLKFVEMKWKTQASRAER